MSSSLDHKCQRCGSQYHGQICPFCTITGLDVNALLAAEGLTMPQQQDSESGEPAGEHAGDGAVVLVDVVSNRTFPCTMPVCRFGRDISNDIVLTGDKSLSRFHFQVTTMNGEYFVEDAGSRNGTFLNGSPVTAPRKILNGDIISAGMTRYRFVLVGEDGELDLNGNGYGDEPSASIAEEAAAEQFTDETARGSEGENKAADPLDKLFKEGQALMSTGGEDAADLDELFHKEKENEAEGSKPPANPFMQLERPKETPVDELFQEQLRAMAAAAQPAVDQSQTNTTPNEVISESKPMPAEPPAERPNDEAPKDAEQAPQQDWPSWCTEFSLGELDSIKETIDSLEEEIRNKEAELQSLKAAFTNTEFVKNSLLASRDSDLMDTISKVLALLGWTTELNANSSNELVVSSDGKTVAIAKVVCTAGQPKPNELANLVSSLSTYWCDHGVEPKGILIVSMLTDGPPSERPPLSDDYASYAQKKNVCLISTLQLLSVYREAALRNADVESIKTSILGASGQLPDFQLD